MSRFKYSLDNKRYHTLNYFYKTKYDCKVFKISLDAGFSCPNISDSGKGCIYCDKNGSAAFPEVKSENLLSQFDHAKKIMNKKWNGKFIGYFQAHSNTFAPIDELKEKYELILGLDDVIGLTIATRSDALNDETLEYLSDLNKRCDLTIELGLQSIKKETTELINRGHSLKCFDDMVGELKSRKINVCVHIINGLPYENEEDMLKTVDHLNLLGINGIKIHMLYIEEGTELAVLYRRESFRVLTKEEYIDIVIKQLEVLDEKIVIHRITGDPNADVLIAPTWLVKKTDLLNSIDKEMVKRDTFQGRLSTR